MSIDSVHISSLGTQSKIRGPCFVITLNHQMESLFTGYVPQGGLLGILSDGDDRKIFLGLKLSIPGFFWGTKIWQVFFWVT